ncbi:hypothetical protein FKP32DRAFT_1566831 [Trametes sanguinea]|nr:hypothetical protein FKP32DRAFT_1566831 [Trametes sanguinea]
MYGGRGTRGSSYGRDNNTRSSYTGGAPSTPTLPPDRNIKDGLVSSSLRTLTKPSGASEEIVKPQNLRYIGSYNWQDETTPTIIVPGSPPIWRDRALPYRVPFDTGIVMVDQNNYRMGTSCGLLPLFRAVDVMSADGSTTVDWGTVDIITDRNGLRKLLRWLAFTGEDTLKEFRIDLQLGGSKTVLMHRWEKRTRENVVPPKGGCGHNFEHESTFAAPGCERSTGHHRIVQYDLGGLKIVVRFEVDACIAGSVSARGIRQAGQGRGAQVATVVAELADILAGLDLFSTTASQPESLGASPIQVIRAGSIVPADSIIELTSRSVRYIHEFSWDEKYPQLVLSQTPHLYLGGHDRGTFQQIRKYRLGGSELRHVESASQQIFKQLVSILRTIQQLMKDHGRQGSLSLVCQSDGALKVYKRTSDAGLLPESELTRFRA